MKAEQDFMMAYSVADTLTVIEWQIELFDGKYGELPTVVFFNSVLTLPLSRHLAQLARHVAGSDAPRIMFPVFISGIPVMPSKSLGEDWLHLVHAPRKIIEAL